MDNIELRAAKERCLRDLKGAWERYAPRMKAVDERLVMYVEDAMSGEGSHANVYELLGIRKVLRLMDSYEVSGERVLRTIRAIEGVWKNGHHVRGGLMFDTPRGNMHVPLMPYQVWCLFGIYAFTTEVDMGREWKEGDMLLPTEWVKRPTPDPSRQGGEGDADGIREERTGRARWEKTALESAGTAANGEASGGEEAKAMVWDRRRLTTEADLFQTRKSGKTGFGAAIDFVEACFLGPVNAQALICAGSRDQAKIAFKAIREYAFQIDPTCINRLGGKFLRVTADEINWQPGQKRKGEIKVMSAGGKRKDGLYASIVHVDEHGQEGYTNGRSNIQELADVCWGSCGPRREKLLLHTTTAGLVSEGPYKTHLENEQAVLLKELEYPLGEAHRTEDDYWFAFILQLDPWEMEYSLDELDDPELFKKVNRSIGTTVQPTWYKERLHAARMSEDTKKEVLTKDFNIWQTGRIQQWMKGDLIRPLQDATKRVTDCKFADGWNVFVGLDFSHGDDLFAITYLCVDYTPSDTMTGRFFADMEAWVLEETMMKSPNRQLYEIWARDGWLKVCPGESFDPTYAINALMEKHEEGVNMVAFGYDPAQSKSPINTLKAWLQSLGIEADAISNMVVPVSQTGMTMNPLVLHVEDLLKTTDKWLMFSGNPMWPWEFGNAAKEIGRTDLARIIKGGPQATHKMDNVAALLDALYCFDLSEGRLEQ